MSKAPTDDQKRLVAQKCFSHGADVLKKGNFDYAIQLLKEACRHAPFQLAYRQHLRFAQMKKWDDNKRGSRVAGVKTMKSRTALKASKAKKEIHRAVELCEDILTENPWDSGILLELANLFESLSDMKQAVWNAEIAAQNNAKSAHVNRSLAHLYERAGDFSKAMDCWERVKNADPTDKDAARKLQQLAASDTIDKGGYEGAKNFTDAIADKERTKELVDEAKGGENRTESLVDQLERKIRKDPTTLGPYMQLSTIHRRQNRLEEANQLMVAARSACGADADIDKELAEIEIDSLKYNLEIAKKIVAESPKDEEKKAKVKELNKALNDFELREYQRQAERLPNDLGLKLELGIRLAKSGKVDLAIAELQKARGDSRRGTDVLLWIGHCFFAKKNWPLAKMNYEEAVPSLRGEREIELKDTVYRLGRIAENMNDAVIAIQHYTELANLDYGYKDVAKRLDELNKSEQDDAVDEDAIPMD